jgi:hypothetical protein
MVQRSHAAAAYTARCIGVTDVPLWIGRAPANATIPWGPLDGASIAGCDASSPVTSALPLWTGFVCAGWAARARFVIRRLFLVWRVRVLA